jgi:hypothetical protein
LEYGSLWLHRTYFCEIYFIYVLDLFWLNFGMVRVAWKCWATNSRNSYVNNCSRRSIGHEPLKLVIDPYVWLGQSVFLIFVLSQTSVIPVFSLSLKSNFICYSQVDKICDVSYIFVLLGLCMVIILWEVSQENFVLLCVNVNIDKNKNIANVYYVTYLIIKFDLMLWNTVSNKCYICTQTNFPFLFSIHMIESSFLSMINLCEAHVVALPNSF